MRIPLLADDPRSTISVIRRPRTLIPVIALLLLTACGGGGGGGGDDDEHAEAHVDTAGRLAVLEAGSSAVRIHDLDSHSIVATFTAAGVPSALHASPGRRYAAVMHRALDLVQFVDGGIWQEDHVDHLHDYKEAPRLLSYRLTGALPTHYESHDDLAALFFDGQAATGRSASVAVLADSSIGNGRAVATLPLATFMHGTAEPRGEFLIATYRAAEADGTLPDQVELYKRDGTGYRLVRRFEEKCSGLHGSFSNERHTAFGCTDGVLLVTQADETFAAHKIANPPEMRPDARIGTITGHHATPTLIGLAAPGLLFAIDPDGKTIAAIEWAAERIPRAYAFDSEGDSFLVLDDRGFLHILDRRTDWSTRATIKLLEAMPAQAPFPGVTVSHADELAYVSDPAGRGLIIVDLATATVKERVPLAFSPTALVWLGIAGHDHAH